VNKIEYTLSSLLTIADNWFKSMFSWFDFWWKAEILKLQQKGKNTYLELVEYDREGKIAAKVKGCIFDEFICRKFLQETKLSLSEMTWLKILFHGRFSFHKEYHFSIVIDELSSEFTLGQLQKKQDDILVELEKLWIAFKNKHTSIGFPPYRLAVISADGAAGLKDFQSVMDHSWYAVHYENYFCAMHGNNAIQWVYEQLVIIRAAIAAWKRIDAVAIIRGGGESSGIIWQNDLPIAKEVCLMPVPVIVAIGHTPDRFILQELAWYGAKTPTDAAYKLLEYLEQWNENIEILYENIYTLSEHKLLLIRENIDQWHHAIHQLLSHGLERVRIQIDAWYNTIVAISPKKLLGSGYALLLQNGEYMTKDAISGLDAGDEFDIQVYDTEFSVKITRKK